MYYKTRNAKWVGCISFLVLAGLLALVGIKSVFTLLCIIMFVWSWTRYFFWVLQTRHLFLWFALTAPPRKFLESTWLSLNQSSVDSRLTRAHNAIHGYAKDNYQSNRHLKEMELVARRFGFGIYYNQESGFE